MSLISVIQEFTGHSINELMELPEDRLEHELTMLDDWLRHMLQRHKILIDDHMTLSVMVKRLSDEIDEFEASIVSA